MLHEQRGRSVYVNAVWVFVALLVGVILGGWAFERQKAEVRRDTCAICGKTGVELGVHDACYAQENAEFRKALEARAVRTDPKTLPHLKGPLSLTENSTSCQVTSQSAIRLPSAVGMVKAHASPSVDER